MISDIKVNKLIKDLEVEKERYRFDGVGTYALLTKIIKRIKEAETGYLDVKEFYKE